MNKKIIIANWKMNSTFDEAQIWVENLSHKLLHKSLKSLPEIVLCPPSIMIDYVSGILMEGEFDEIEKLHKNVDEIEEKELEKLVANLRKINLGGQDCAACENGAYTGDISAKMIKDCGAEYVIIGHCERRQNHKESNSIVAKKVAAAINHQLIPILCVGESKEQREKGKCAEFIVEQIEQCVPKNVSIDKLVVAYEPIWSIGSGTTPTLEEIEEIAELIKKELHKNKNISHFKIAYGGSVNAKNSGEILKAKNVDGLLVGGASLDVNEFFEIIKSA